MMFFENKVQLSQDIASHRQNGGGECRNFAMSKRRRKIAR